MKRLLKFLVLLVPYVAFVAVCPIIGAAFFIPDTVFRTIGEAGLGAAIAIAAVSLIVIVWTDHTLVGTGLRLNREYNRSETEQKNS